MKYRKGMRPGKPLPALETKSESEKRYKITYTDARRLGPITVGGTYRFNPGGSRVVGNDGEYLIRLANEPDLFIIEGTEEPLSPVDQIDAEHIKQETDTPDGYEIRISCSYATTPQPDDPPSEVKIIPILHTERQ